jgi:hypothetical protein
MAKTKTSADFEADRDAAAAEIERLGQARPAAALIGPEALRSHLKKLDDATIQYEIAAAGAGEAARQKEESLAQENNSKFIALYQNAKHLGEKSSARILVEWNPACETLVELATEARSADFAIKAVNRSLPAGMEPLPPVEAFRHIAATADKFEDVTVTRPAIDESAGTHIVHRPSALAPARQTVTTERRLISRGERAFTPPSLADSLALPALYRDAPMFHVTGSKAARAWWWDN